MGRPWVGLEGLYVPEAWPELEWGVVQVAVRR